MEFDPFDKLEVRFTGYFPEVKVEFVRGTQDKFIHSLEYEVNNIGEIETGDTVEIEAIIPRQEAYDLGYNYPESTTLTVEAGFLGDFIDELEQLPIEIQKEIAQDGYAYMANLLANDPLEIFNYDKDYSSKLSKVPPGYSGGKPELLAAYVIRNKSKERISWPDSGINNAIFLYYALPMQGVDETYYGAVLYKEIERQSDGTFELDVTSRVEKFATDYKEMHDDYMQSVGVNNFIHEESLSYIEGLMNNE